MKRLPYFAFFAFASFAFGQGTLPPIYYLRELLDTGISSPINAQALTYNAATGKWVNTTLSAGGGGTVTSVGLSTNVSWLTVGSSPITTAGTITLNGNFPGNAALFLNGTGAFSTPPGSSTSGTSVLSGNGSGGFTNVTIGTGLSYDSGTHTLTGTGVQTHSITFFVDGAGGVLSTGTKNPIKVPYGGTLQGWTMMCSPSGSVTADVLRAADGAGLPVTSIVGGGGTKPAVASNVEAKSTSFSGWTSTTITANDNLAFSLSGITNATYCVLTLYYQ